MCFRRCSGRFGSGDGVTGGTEHGHQLVQCPRLGNGPSAPGRENMSADMCAENRALRERHGPISEFFSPKTYLLRPRSHAHASWAQRRAERQNAPSL